MKETKRILVAVRRRELWDQIAGLLGRSGFEVNRVPSGAGALILVGNLRYDLIIVEAPLPDLDLQEFVAAVRTLDSPCAGSSVLVMARDESVGLSSALSGDRVVILPADTERERLQKSVSQLLGVALRTAARLLVQIETEMENGTSARVAQTVNLSESGMLLRSAPLAPIGSEVRLTFALPGDPAEIVARAEVVRHTAPELELVRGIGVHFVELPAETVERLRSFVNGRETGPGQPAAGPGAARIGESA